MTDTTGHNKGRRQLLMGGAAVAATLAMPMINSNRYQAFAGDDKTYSARAIELLENSLVIDMLNPVGSSQSQGRHFRGR